MPVEPAFGAECTPSGVRFRLWAPRHEWIELVIEGRSAPLRMRPLADGWHELTTGDARDGTLYRYRSPDGLSFPDPAARFQPCDVHGPSEVVDPAKYRWKESSWRGRPWEECILYELHVGAFTPEGTFAAAAAKLDELAALGITAIELMPVAAFPGRCNWGYDGVFPFAPDATYGRPEDLKALIDGAHARGLAILLDVVYNHFGPEGNYLPHLGPIFTDRHHTPWGAAVNYDGVACAAVRRLAIQNALYWLEEYRFDGLRLDAVHAIIDDSSPHLLEELALQVRERCPDRHVHLLLENEANQSRLLERQADGRARLYTAQWNDDVHHVLHVAATGERIGYYSDYLDAEERLDLDKLGRALAEGFAFQGEAMSYSGHPRGEPSAHLPPTAFVAFIQNHDQVGNRACGDRLSASVEPRRLRAVAAMYLLLPQIPMIFMGEEWGATQPFPFFCDFAPPLADAVRNGRRKEFARFPEFRDAAGCARIPDPTAADTFQSAKLRWSDRDRPVHAEWLDWYRRILAVRRAHIVPRLAGSSGRCARYAIEAGRAVRVQWTLGDGSQLLLVANVTDQALERASRPLEAPQGIRLWTEGEFSADSLGAWSVSWQWRPA